MLAAVRLFASVGPFVDAQMTRSSKAFATVLAAVKFLARVGPHVLVQSSCTTEAFAALLAAVGLLTGVDPFMHVQVARLCEALAALLAGVRLRARALSPCNSPLARGVFACVMLCSVCVRDGVYIGPARCVSSEFVAAGLSRSAALCV